MVPLNRRSPSNRKAKAAAMLKTTAKWAGEILGEWGGEQHVMMWMNELWVRQMEGHGTAIRDDVGELMVRQMEGLMALNPPPTVTPWCCDGAGGGKFADGELMEDDDEQQPQSRKGVKKTRMPAIDLQVRDTTGMGQASPPICLSVMHVHIESIPSLYMVV